MAQRGLPWSLRIGSPVCWRIYFGIAPLLRAYAPKIAAGLLNLDAHATDMARRGIEARMVDGGLLQPAAVARAIAKG